MLHVKTKIGPSNISGIGLFADQNIPKGTVIWKFDPRFDLSFSPQKVENLPQIQKELLNCYAYRSTTQNKYIYAVDDSRFANHSSKKFNTDVILLQGDVEKSFIANRDIVQGEEILDNYRSYDAKDATSDISYLNN